MISYSKINEVKEILEIDRRVANINTDKIPIKYIVAHMLYQNYRDDEKELIETFIKDIQEYRLTKNSQLKQKLNKEINKLTRNFYYNKREKGFLETFLDWDIDFQLTRLDLIPQNELLTFLIAPHDGSDTKVFI